MTGTYRECALNWRGRMVAKSKQRLDAAGILAWRCSIDVIDLPLLVKWEDFQNFEYVLNG